MCFMVDKVDNNTEWILNVGCFFFFFCFRHPPFQSGLLVNEVSADSCRLMLTNPKNSNLCLMFVHMDE